MAYKKGIAELQVPDGYTVDTFYVINNCPELKDCMGRTDEWIEINSDHEYEKTDNDHIWTKDNMEFVGSLRNRTIQYALANGYDYWFSIDTDLVLHPMTLKQLIEADRDIVSEIFWTNGWCNAWMEGQANGMQQTWQLPGLYRCGMTGACMLVKRRVLEAGVNYTYIKNIRNTVKGEDRHFCVRAECAGFELWVDTHYPATHLYTERDYLEYKKKIGVKKMENALYNETKNDEHKDT